jgi:hypothetical protein
MKIFFTLLGILILLVFVHPSTEVYEAQVSGSVVDIKGNPISGAIVKRVSDKQTRNPGGSYTITKIYSEQTVTDRNGHYLLPEKKRQVWFHNPVKYLMPWIHCDAEMEVSVNGAKIFASGFKDKDLYFYNENAWACRGVQFKKDFRVGV